MAITVVGTASSATTTVAVPAHAIGDLILIFAYRNAITAPSLGSGFSTLASKSGNSNAFIIGYRVATATNDASGTWTNANVLLCIVYRGAALGINTVGQTNVADTTCAIAGIASGSFANTSGSSWIVAFAASRQTATQGTPLTQATTSRVTQAGTTANAIIADTNAGVSVFTATTSSNTTSVVSASAALELMPTSAPSPPSGLVATPSTTTAAALTWSAPTSNGFSSITDYKIEYSTDGTTWNTFSHGASTATSITVTGLTSGAPYCFRVSAVNAVGTSAASNLAVATTSISGAGYTRRFGYSDQVITAPGNLLGFTYGTLAVVVFATPMAVGSGYYWNFSFISGSTGSSFYNGIADASGAIRMGSQFDVVWPAGVGWRLVVMTKGTGSISPKYWVYDVYSGTWLLDGVLAPTPLGDAYGTTAHITIGYINGDPSYIAGEGMWKNQELTNAQVHTLINNWDAWTALSPTSLHILDQASVGTAVTDYTGGGANQTFLSGTTAIANSAPLGWAPRAPGQVTNLVATPATTTSMGLVWLAPTDTGHSALTNYLVEYSTDGSSWATFSHTVSTTPSITVTGLSQSVLYYFRVSAINAIGTGTPSAVRSGYIGVRTSRRFNWNDNIRVNAGSALSGFTYGTIAVLINIDPLLHGQGEYVYWADLRDSGDNQALAVPVRDVSGYIAHGVQIGGGATELDIVWPAGSGWRLVVVAKGTGTVPVHHWIYDYSTGSWLVDDVSSTAMLADSTILPVTYGYLSYSFMLDGRAHLLAGEAVWANQALTGTQVHSLATYVWDDWMALSPSSLHVLDQASTGTAVTDFTGHGATQLDFNGTAVVPFSAPIGWLPAQVTGVGATPTSASSITVSWALDTSGYVTNYIIDLSTDGTNWTTYFGTTSSGVATFLATGLTRGTRYYFRVSAFADVGVGPVSATVSALATPTVIGRTGLASATVGTGTSTTSSTTLTVSTPKVAAGEMVFMAVVCDNVTNASLPTVTAITKGAAGETKAWVRIGSVDSSSATAGAGVRGELWAIQTTVDWLSGSSVVTFSTAITAKAGLAWTFYGATITPRGTVPSGTTGAAGVSTTGTPTATTAGTALVAGDLVLGLAVTEGTTIPGLDSDTLNGVPWASLSSGIATSGSATTAVAVRVHYKVVTGSAPQTFNPPCNTDSGVAVVGLIAQTITFVTATRGTSWAIHAPGPWSAYATATTLTSVTATCGTTWAIGAYVTATRSTTWAQRASVVATRSAVWAVHAPGPWSGYASCTTFADTKGSATTSWTFSPDSAVGKETAKSTVVINDTFNPLATGKEVPKGTANTANYVETLTIQGKRFPKATAVINNTWVPTAIGAMPVVNMNQGAATVSYTYNPVAVGKRTPKSALVINNTFNPVVAGRKIQKGVTTTQWRASTTGGSPPVSYDQEVLVDNPWGYWPLNGNANDVLGLHNGTPDAGVTWTAGRIGSAAQIPGGTAGINVGTGDAVGAIPAMSLEAWFNLPSAPPAISGLIAADSNVGASTSNFFLRVQAAGTVRAGFYVGGVLSVTTSSSGNICDGQWHHIVATKVSGAGTLIYVDGVVTGVQGASTTGNVQTNTGVPITLGHFGGATDAFSLNGPLDECAIYPYALSPARIAAHYAAGTGGGSGGAEGWAVGKRTPVSTVTTTALQTVTALGKRAPQGAASTGFFIYALVAQGVKPANMNQGSGIALWRESLTGGSPGGSAPTLSVLAGLSVWLDAVNYTGTTWPNEGSGAAPTLVGPPMTVNPATLNGLPVVRFKADEGRLRGAWPDDVATFTLLYLFRFIGPNPGRSFSAVYPPSNFLIGTHTSKKDTVYSNGVWIDGPDTSWASWSLPGPWRMYEADSLPGTLRFFIDGALIGSADPGQGLFNGWGLSGYDPAGTQETIDMEIAEFVLYNRRLSDAERIQVEDYLQFKWLGIGSAPTSGTEGWAIGQRTPKGGNAIVDTWVLAAAGKKFQYGVATTTTWTEVVAAAGKRVARSDVISTYTAAVAAVGTKTPKGTSVTAYTWAPAAIGAKPDVPMNQGAATVRHDWTPAAVGKRTPKASAAASYYEVLAVAGKRIQQGTASASWDATGVAVGKRTPVSTVATSVLQTIAAIGWRFPKATATANVTYTQVAQGFAPLPGVHQGSGLVSWRASTKGGSPSDVPPAVLPVTAGLLIHLDATLIGAADGVSLGSWADTSGNGLPALATSGTSTYRSAGINGHPAVRFGESGISEMQVNHGHWVSDRTVFQVVQTVGGSNGPYHTTQLQELSPYMQTYGTNGGTINTYATPAPLSSGVGWSGVPQMISLWCSTATSSQGLEVDGTQVTAAWSPEATPSKWFIGGFTPASYGMNGFIGEMIIYERCLSAIERQQVQNYLNTKWAVGGGSTGSGLEGWAIGKRIPKANSIVTTTWALAAAGKKTQQGSATASWSTTIPTAIGKKTQKATATTTYTYDAPAAVGYRAPKGVATPGNHLWTMTAQGMKTAFLLKQGSGLTFHTWVLPAAGGKKTPKGSASVSVSYSQTAVGKRQPVGEATTTSLWQTDATGKKIQKGVADPIEHTWSLTVTDKKEPKGSGDTDYWFSQVALGIDGVVAIPEGMWNGEEFKEMQFGGKAVIGWILTPP